MMHQASCMKAFKQYIFFIYQCGFVEVYHKVDEYWEDLTLSPMVKSYNMHLAIGVGSNFIILSWNSGNPNALLSKLNVDDYLYG